MLLHPVEPHKITGGCSGELRQEYRELELLDEITRLRFEGLLPDSVSGHKRTLLIRSFQEYKGVGYVPRHVHPSIRWTDKEGPHIIAEEEFYEWRIVTKDKRKGKKSVQETTYVTAKGTAAYADGNCVGSTDEERLPVVVPWDTVDYSCAYDCMLVILYEMWAQNSKKWKTIFVKRNDKLALLAKVFHDVSVGRSSMETVRYRLRKTLHDEQPTIFRWGPIPLEIHHLVSALLTYNARIEPSCTCIATCSRCGASQAFDCDLFSKAIVCLTYWEGTRSQKLLDDAIRTYCHQNACTTCQADMEDSTVQFLLSPNIIALEINPSTSPTVDRALKIRKNGEKQRFMHFPLTGIIYLDRERVHFVATVFRGRDAWHYDGMAEELCTKAKKRLTDSQLTRHRLYRTEACAGILIYSRP